MMTDEKLNNSKNMAKNEEFVKQVKETATSTNKSNKNNYSIFTEIY